GCVQVPDVACRCRPGGPRSRRGCAARPRIAPRIERPHAPHEETMAHGGNTARTPDPAEPLRLVEESGMPETPVGTADGGWLRMHLRTWRPVYLAFALSRLLVLVVGFGAELVMRLTDADPARWRPFAFAETY